MQTDLFDEFKKQKWFSRFDERQQKEIVWAFLYAGGSFGHGTVGHNQLMIIAKMADMLNKQWHDTE